MGELGSSPRFHNYYFIDAFYFTAFLIVDLVKNGQIVRGLAMLRSKGLIVCQHSLRAQIESRDISIAHPAIAFCCSDRTVVVDRSDAMHSMRTVR